MLQVLDGNLSLFPGYHMVENPTRYLVPLRKREQWRVVLCIAFLL